MQGCRRTLDYMSLEYVPIGLDVDSIPGWFGLTAKTWFGLTGKTMSLNNFGDYRVIHHCTTLNFKSIKFIMDTIKPDIINRFPKDDKLKL